jgi:hypothetical protein
VKNFILALFSLISSALVRSWERVRSGQARQLAAEGFGKVKSLFAPQDYDGSRSRRRLILLSAAAAAIVVVIVCVRLFMPSRTGASPRKALVAPELRDASGNIWTLQLMKGQSAWITGDSDPGPPLVIRTEAQAYGDTVTIGVHLEGQAGEKYVPGVLKAGVWQPAPKFQLVGENGQVLAAGQFEYG